MVSTLNSAIAFEMVWRRSGVSSGFRMATCMDDFAVRSFIKLELFSVTEMLKNLTVFIGDCNFHNGFSFAFFVEFFRVASLHPAAAAAVGCLLSSADTVVSCFVSDFFYYQYGICRMYSKENPQYFRLPVSGLYP